MILYIGFVIMAFAVIAGLGLAFAGGDGAGKTAKRVQAMGSGARQDKSRAKAATQDQAGRRKQIQQSLKANERQERKAKLNLEARIRQAGLSISLQTFWMISAALALVFAFMAMLLHASMPIAIGVGLVTGLGLPRWALSFLAQGRVKKFTAEFPNAIDIIVRGIKSGLPVNDCLKVIARESPEPLSTEFRRLVESLGLGMTLEQALEKMYERMPTSEVRFFAIVLSIQQKTGGNLAEALSNLSSVLRARKLLREKIKAMSGEAVASAAIIGSLPPGIMALISVTNRSYMLPLIEDPRGHAMLLFGAVWMASGIFVMRKMINFKF